MLTFGGNRAEYSLESQVYGCFRWHKSRHVCFVLRLGKVKWGLCYAVSNIAPQTFSGIYWFNWTLIDDVRNRIIKRHFICYSLLFFGLTASCCVCLLPYFRFNRFFVPKSGKFCMFFSPFEANMGGANQWLDSKLEPQLPEKMFNKRKAYEVVTKHWKECQ